MTQQQFNTAIELIDAANSEDPNLEISDNNEQPKELLYSHRMSDMLRRYMLDADDAMKLAIHAQHIQRWKTPRSDYPMNRKGYHQWRTGLYTFHAEAVASLLRKVGYEADLIERVKQAVGKKSLKRNPDAQLLEDVASLVFIEHYLLEFVNKHSEYDEQKWLNIIRKTWKKMSDQAQQFALGEQIVLPDQLIPLIQKAVLK